MEALWTYKDVAEFLHVAVRTVMRWVAQERIPYIRLKTGKRGPVRFEPNKIREWIKKAQINQVR